MEMARDDPSVGLGNADYKQSLMPILYTNSHNDWI
jgi:hypothetical protein